MVALGTVDAISGEPYCGLDAMLANTFVGHRQAQGTDRTEMIRQLGENPTIVEMINQAYDSPVMDTPKDRQKAIDGFRDVWVQRCVENGPAMPAIIPDVAANSD